MMKGNLTRSDLSQAVLEALGLSYSESEKLVDSFFEYITQALEKGEDVKIASWGTFKLRKKSQRMGRNPKNGKSYPIKAHTAVSFVPSMLLKKSLTHVDLED